MESDAKESGIPEEPDEEHFVPAESQGREAPEPVVQRVPSLDELSNDLDVPSELPSVLRSVEVLGLEGIGKLVEARRVESALQQLPRGAHGLAGALLRLRCLSRLRRWRLAAEECQEPPLQGTPQAQLLLAQLPYLEEGAAYEAMLKLQALASDWLQAPLEHLELRLQLLQRLSELSLRAGHGALGAEELRKALRAAPERQLWSLLGRHHLAWGRLNEAQEAFQEAKGEGQEAAVLLNEGLLCMSKSDYAAATDAFQAASAATSDDEEKLAAENNLAVCKFYTKDLRGACERLEVLVKREPLRFMKPCLLQNLASLYEFSQDAAGKRRQLQMLAATSQLEDLEEKLFHAPQM